MQPLFKSRNLSSSHAIIPKVLNSFSKSHDLFFGKTTPRGAMEPILESQKGNQNDIFSFKEQLMVFQKLLR